MVFLKNIKVFMKGITRSVRSAISMEQKNTLMVQSIM